MKHIYLFVLLFSFIFNIQAGFAQQKGNVGIGTKEPDQSAILDLSSSNKGFLVPRLTLKERENIQSPAQGLIIYQKDNLTGFYYYEDDQWKPLGRVDAQNLFASDPNDWSFTGNSIPNGAFLGTTNARALAFKVNNIGAGYIHPSNRSTFLGLYSGELNSGNDNTAMGYSSLAANTSGYSNIALGMNALSKNTIGAYNVAIGSYALRESIGSHGNIAIGYEALRNNNGEGGGYNVAIGRDALKANTIGVENTAIGYKALMSNTTGERNFAIGVQALATKTSGNNNLALGYLAGEKNVSGSSNVFIGYGAGRNETGSEKLYIANNSTLTPLIYGDFSAKFISIGDVPVAKRNAVAAAGYGLLVKGGILTEKVKVALASTNDWADYVFEDDYHRMSLEETEAFIKAYKHLPNVPSAQQMLETGMDVQETSKILLEKIEELTLHIIELNKEVNALKKRKVRKRFFSKSILTNL